MEVVDYEALYSEVNEIARALWTLKVRCSEVMAINRMFVRLDTLSVEHLQQPEIVKSLIVVADVVEIEGSSSLTLPGSSLILITCRLLRVKQKNAVLNLAWNLAATGTTASLPRCSIYTQQVDVSNGSTLRIQVKRELKWSNGSPFTQYFGHEFSYSSSTKKFSTMSAPAADYSVKSVGQPPESKLILVNTRKMNILMNGVAWKGFIDFEVAMPSLNDLAHPSVIEGIESNLLIVEMILNYQTNVKDLVTAAKDHVEWINKSILEVVDWPNSEVGLQLKALLGRAQMLLKMPSDGSESLIVPQLEYSGYEQVIQEMAKLAESYNTEFRELNALILNSQVIGQNILNQTKILGAKEREVQNLESLVVLRKQKELDQAIERLEILENQLIRQVDEMEAAKTKLDQGLQAYKNEQIARAFFSVLGAMMQIAGSARLSSIPEIVVGIGGGISEALSATEKVKDAIVSNTLQDVANKLRNVERVMEVVNSVKDLYTNATNLEDILNAPQIPDVPSSDWEIMRNDMEEVAAGMPTEVSEVSTWQAKCKNVVAVCEEICTTATSISNTQCDLFVHVEQQEIAKRQAERLNQMQAVDLGDYLEMATQLDMCTMRVLICLLKMLGIQNGALQYQYLLAPQPFIGWPTIDNVRMEMLRRVELAVLAKVQLGPPVALTHQYVIESIPVGLLMSGDDWNFSIDASDISVFPSTWSQVRIRYLEMKFTGEHHPITETGEVYLLLQASSKFEDRLKTQMFQYEAAAPLTYQYAYNLQTGETTLPNLPHEEGTFLRMSPFTRWRLRLSASAYQNQGLSFPTTTSLDNSISISITFYLTAIVQIQTRLPGGSVYNLFDDDDGDDKQQLEGAEQGGGGEEEAGSPI